MCVRRDFGKTNTRGGFGAGYIDKGTGGVTGIRENRKSYYRRKVLTRGGGGRLGRKRKGSEMRDG